MSERPLREQMRHLLIEMELVAGLLRASQQTREVKALVEIFRRRGKSFERSGFRKSFMGSRAVAPIMPAPFPLTSTLQDALLRLALGCEAAAELHETPHLPLRKSDLLSFAETLRERRAGVKSRPPVSMEKVAAFSAWPSGDKPLFVICDAGFWNHQSRGIGEGKCYAISRGKSSTQGGEITPSSSYIPALRLLLNERYPGSHHTIHVVIDGPAKLEIFATLPRARDEHPRIQTDEILREEFEKRRVPLDQTEAFFRAF